jgi:hypothetical protein
MGVGSEKSFSSVENPSAVLPLEIYSEISSFLMAIHPTHLKKKDNINLKHYSVYSTYVEEDERAAGGSTILVRDNILHSYVNLNTDLQAVEPFLRPPFGDLLGDLLVSDGDSSIGDGESSGGRFHTDSSSASSRQKKL